MAYARRQVEDSMSRFEEIAERAAEELRRAAEQFETIAADAAEQLRESAALWEQEVLNGDAENHDDTDRR